jgi:hypothetical protein
MLNYFIIISLIILVIILIVLYNNQKIIKNTIESYGEYCGRYMHNDTTPEKRVGKRLCLRDLNCVLKNYTARDGSRHPYCTINPNPPYEEGEYDEDDRRLSDFMS